LALKNEDDKIFEEAQSWMRRFLKNEFGQIYTSTFVFDDLVTLVLVRIKRADFAKDIGSYILESTKINMVGFTEDDFSKSWRIFNKYIDKRLSFIDCTILVQCERLNCDFLGTFDAHFKGLISTTLT